MSSQWANGPETVTRTVVCEDELATRGLGRRVGAALEAGALIGLSGPLGAGKTVFVQGLARGLGVPAEVRVKSPTYAIVHEHQGRLPLYHLDLYRLDSLEDMEGIGYRELFESAGVCAVEWSDRVPEAFPAAHLSVTIEIVEAGRRIRLSARGGHAADAIDWIGCLS